MIPAHCRIKHDPDAGTYGDCLRACVASLIEKDTEFVPHFADGHPAGDVAFHTMREWLKPQGLAPVVIGFPDDPMDDLLAFMGERHPDVHYILFGGTKDGGDHCVICKGGAVVHNPAWFGCSIVGPSSLGHWQIVLITRI